jgi:MFS superfamily sulfate permease-like transporter
MKKEILELIYHFDYTVAQKAKKISRSINEYTRISIGWQYTILHMIVLMSLLYGYDDAFIPRNILAMILTGAFHILFTLIVILFLVEIHRRIDPDNTDYFSVILRKNNKYAWAQILVGCMSIVYSYFFPPVHPYYIEYWGALYIVDAYKTFVFSNSKPPKKRIKNTQTSSALQKLLERCSEWLGQRQPFPTN